jgi:hypothetical protein
MVASRCAQRLSLQAGLEFARRHGSLGDHPGEIFYHVEQRLLGRSFVEVVLRSCHREFERHERHFHFPLAFGPMIHHFWRPDVAIHDIAQDARRDPDGFAIVQDRRISVDGDDFVRRFVCDDVGQPFFVLAIAAPNKLFLVGHARSPPLHKYHILCIMRQLMGVMPCIL